MQAPRKSPAAAASLPHFPQTGRARTFKRYTGIRTLLCACGSCLIRDRWIPCPVVLGGSGREECWCRNSHADRMHSNPLMPLQHGHNGFPCRCTSGGSLAGVHWAGKWYVLFSYPPSVSQTTIDCHHHFSGPCPVSVFTEPDSLPGTQVELPIRDWDGETSPKQDGLDMCRHVVWALAGMLIR